MVQLRYISSGGGFDPPAQDGLLSDAALLVQHPGGAAGAAAADDPAPAAGSDEASTDEEETADPTKMSGVCSDWAQAVCRRCDSLKALLLRSRCGRRWEGERHWNLEMFDQLAEGLHGKGSYGRRYIATQNFMTPEIGRETKQLRFLRGDIIVVTSAPPRDPNRAAHEVTW